MKKEMKARVFKRGSYWWATLDGIAFLGAYTWESAMRLSLPYEEYKRRYGWHQVDDMISCKEGTNDVDVAIVNRGLASPSLKVERTPAYVICPNCKNFVEISHAWPATCYTCMTDLKKSIAEKYPNYNA